MFGPNRAEITFTLIKSATASGSTPPEMVHQILHKLNKQKKTVTQYSGYVKCAGNNTKWSVRSALIKTYLTLWRL